MWGEGLCSKSVHCLFVSPTCDLLTWSITVAAAHNDPMSCASCTILLSHLAVQLIQTAFTKTLLSTSTPQNYDKTNTKNT